MKKFLLIILSLTSLCVAGQSRINGVYISEVNLFKQDTFKYWISSFNHGIAKFSKDGYYGIIDTTGNVLVKSKYDEIIFFDDYILYSSNRTLKCVDYKLEIIDLKSHGYENIDYGKIFVPALNRYFFRHTFFNGLLRINESEAGQNPKLSFINDQGIIKIDASKYTLATEFWNGYASVQYNGLWGAIDTLGREIVEPAYDYSIYFYDGVAKVTIDSKVGFVDTTGRLIVPIIYDHAEASNEGLIAVQRDGKYGFVNHNGEVILDFMYDQAQPFVTGIAKVKINNKEGYINRQGDFIHGPEDTLSKIFYKGKLTSIRKGKYWTFVDYKGNTIDTIISDEPFYFDDDGYAKFNRWPKHGFVNRLGEVIYYPARTFWVNKGVVRYNYLDKFGFVDRNGNIIVQPVYDLVFDFHGDIACVKLNEKWGAIDKKGNVVIPIKYTVNFLDFSENGLSIVSDSVKFGVINRQGKTIIPIKYDQITRDLSYLKSGGLYIVSEHGKTGVYDFTGKLVVPIKYDRIRVVGNQYIISSEKNKIIIFNSSGELIKSIDGKLEFATDKVLTFENNEMKGFYHFKSKSYCAPKFNYISWSNNTDTGIVCINRLCGYINYKGDYIIKPSFRSAQDFSNGIAIVFDYDGHRYINNKGEKIFKKYDEINRFIDGLALVKLNNKYGFIDVSGKEVVPPQYIEAMQFGDGLAPVKINDKWGYIDKSNQLVIPAEYDTVNPFGEGYANVSKGSKRFTINTKNRIVNR